MTYRLNIHKLEQSCLFELTWGQGQRLPATLPYPHQLATLYPAWRRAYTHYYQQALRGRVAASGQVTATTVDWHSQVVQAEARLLLEFHKWLRHEALFDLRAELVRGQFLRQESHSAVADKRELFLSCSSLEMARWPWETWEIGADLGQQEQIQIVRSPATIRSTTVSGQSFRRGKPRVLAILGDERNLNFAGDRTALEAQKSLDLHYVGWQPGGDTLVLKETICQAIADGQGWDVLFFAGHSNEAALVDGQIAIAPNTAISMRELYPYLIQAKERGLQFALFNSCCGLDIANGLVDLGLSQVAIMREPIHNDVAHSFLLQFLQRLAAFQDAQSALIGACQFLKLEKNLTYPSAYLVPSLFRHPNSRPYQIRPRGWRSVLQQWRPQKVEAIAVGILLGLSLMPAIQQGLLNHRLAMQARYRHWTAQLPVDDTRILLVQIDDRTLQERQIAAPNPIDRSLLADLVTVLTRLDAPVIGFDYVLDRPQPEWDSQLRQGFEAAATQGRWIVLAAKRSHLGEWLTASPTVAATDWSLPGDIWSSLWYLPTRGWSDQRPLPFSYQLATAYRLAQTPTQATVPRPELTAKQPLQATIAAYGKTLEPGQEILPQRAQLHPITNAAYPLQQRWLQPLLDFSIPPARLYRTVSAWRLLQAPEAVLQTLAQASLQDVLVIVAPGGYDEAGFTEPGEDNLPRPHAITYWHRQDQSQAPQGFTGGEIHAYAAHHLLNHHLVVPLPDTWLVLLAVLAGKAIVITTHAGQRRPVGTAASVVSATLLYGWLSLQLYISGAVLLPWLLPSLTLWFYSSQLIWNQDNA